MSTKSFNIGEYCPPSEGYALLLQVTENCPWTKCKFCNMYHEKKFALRPMETLKNEIDAMAIVRDRILQYASPEGILDMEKVQAQYLALDSDEERFCYDTVFLWLTKGRCESLFLQDGDSLAAPPEFLLEVLNHLKLRFPELQRVTSYCRARSLARISEEQFKALHEAGLGRLYCGFESGSDAVLSLVDKGATQQEEIIGGCRVKAAGIELSIFYMPGVGGKRLSKEHTLETAKVINIVNPDFVRVRTFHLYENTMMMDLLRSGAYEPMTDMDKLMEIRLLLDYIDPTSVTGTFLSDHNMNLLEDVGGSMADDLEAMRNYIDSFLALPRQEQRFYQVARRLGFARDWTRLHQLPEEVIKQIGAIIQGIPDGPEWDKLLHSFIDRQQD